MHHALTVLERHLARSVDTQLANVMFWATDHTMMKTIAKSLALAALVGDASANSCLDAAAKVGFTTGVGSGATCSCANPSTSGSTPICATATGGSTKQACPAGCQALIDDTYTECDGADGWDTNKPGYKTFAEMLGCGGATQAAPAFFVALAAITNHFLN